MRSKIILILAIVMGVITTFLFFDYMKKFDEKKAVNDNLVEVIAAKQPIKQNQMVTAAMVEKVHVPKKGLHEQTVMKAAEIEGKYATSNIEKGEQLLGHRLKTEKAEAVFVSRKISEGFRAVTVGVNLVQSVSNLIEPEDVVDVVSTPSDKTGGQVVSSLILSKVKVLAVGKRMVEADAETARAEYSSVTLELKPQDAVKVISADENGNISLILHSRIIPAPEVKQ